MTTPKTFDAVVGAGSLRSTDPAATHFTNRWTPDGTTVETDFSGAHLFHLATAGCVLNDIYREADALNVTINGVRVSAWGGFDKADWKSTGVKYRVEVDSDADETKVAELVNLVDTIAEMPRTIRLGADVQRVAAR